MVGIGFANLITRVLLRQMSVTYRVEWLWGAAGLVGTMMLTVMTGWVASHRILGQKPLEVLREE